MKSGRTVPECEADADCWEEGALGESQECSQDS